MKLKVGMAKGQPARVPGAGRGEEGRGWTLRGKESGPRYVGESLVKLVLLSIGRRFELCLIYHAVLLSL